MFQICSDLSKTALKYTIFANIQKRPKNCQMAKPFYFWQTVSKKAKWQPWYDEGLQNCIGKSDK